MSEVDVCSIICKMQLPSIIENPFYVYKNLHLNRLVKNAPYELLWTSNDTLQQVDRYAFITFDKITIYRIFMPKVVAKDLSERLQLRKSMQDKLGLIVTEDRSLKYGKLQWV